MSLRNRLGLYGSYFLGMAGIGITQPFLPLLLAERGLRDRAIGIVSTIAAVAGLAQFPLGVWSDHIGRRKPFLIAALTLLAISTYALSLAHNAIVLSFLVSVIFSEQTVSFVVDQTGRYTPVPCVSPTVLTTNFC